MKETVKAGIGGYAFTLDADAYDLLRLYLDNLKVHFENKEDGSEIIADIEARMCELLQMKTGKIESIITLDDANSIINIMGNPVDFKEEAANETNNIQPEKSENAPIRKKLYRDTEDKILGGVCAGLAKYFHIDPVIIRVGYAASIASAGFITDKLGGYIFLSYFLLWVAMPKAKTMTQKLAMSGEDPSVEAIENRTARIPRKRDNHIESVLGSIIKAVSGTIVFMMGLAIALLGGFLIFFPTAFDFPSISDLLTIFGLYSSNISIALAIMWFLPAICLIYLGIIIYTKITPKDFVIFGISFLIWISAGAYISFVSTKQVKNYKENADFTEKIDVNTASDTLYVRLHPDLQNAYNWEKDDDGLYILDSNPKSWFILSKVHVNQDTVYKKVEVKIKKKAFDKSYQGAKTKATDAKFDYSVQDSLILLRPHLYNKNQPWDRELFEVEINTPSGKTVIIDEPIGYQYHYFNN